MDPKTYINQLFAVVDTRSILVYTDKHSFKRIYCPFNVIVIRTIGKLNEGEIHAVLAVKMSLELIDVYIIAGKAYSYYHFRLYL
jgi:hypothetical protein